MDLNTLIRGAVHLLKNNLKSEFNFVKIFYDLLLFEKKKSER